MKKLLFTLLMCTLSFPWVAGASQVQISATAYSSDNCQYFSTSLADLNLNFVNTLPWGTRVIFRYGFHDTFSNSNWTASSQVELNATAPYTWTASLKGIEVDSRGEYSFDSIQFDFEIIAADGTSTYDNGGSSYGFYQATLPSRGCQAGILQPLTQSIVGR